MTLPSSVHRSGLWAGRVAVLAEPGQDSDSPILLTDGTRARAYARGAGTAHTRLVLDSTYRSVRKGRLMPPTVRKGMRIAVRDDAAELVLGHDDYPEIPPGSEVWIFGVRESPGENIYWSQS
ncbi:hypothetical protein EON79_02375 [bacterium]|nr:MAG: hypothetical protein EON79_02375 [bacterium]